MDINIRRLYIPGNNCGVLYSLHTEQIRTRNFPKKSVPVCCFYNFLSEGSSSASGCRKAYLEIQLVESKLDQEKTLDKVKLTSPHSSRDFHINFIYQEAEQQSPGPVRLCGKESQYKRTDLQYNYVDQSSTTLYRLIKTSNEILE